MRPGPEVGGATALRLSLTFRHIATTARARTHALGGGGGAAYPGLEYPLDLLDAGGASRGPLCH